MFMASTPASATTTMMPTSPGVIVDGHRHPQYPSNNANDDQPPVPVVIPSPSVDDGVHAHAQPLDGRYNHQQNHPPLDSTGQNPRAPATPNKVPNWLALSRLFQSILEPPSLGESGIVPVFLQVLLCATESHRLSHVKGRLYYAVVMYYIQLTC